MIVPIKDIFVNKKYHRSKELFYLQILIEYNLEENRNDKWVGFSNMIKVKSFKENEFEAYRGKVVSAVHLDKIRVKELGGINIIIS